MRDDELDWAWFAGLFEGEGSIGFQGVNAVYLTIEMIDEDIINRAHDIAGGTVITYHREIKGKLHQRWRWKANNQHDVRDVIERISPYLGERRSVKMTEARERLSRIRTYPRVAA